MPKEITHWIIASKTAERLRGTCAGEAAVENPNCLLIGAVFHDSLFYLRKSKRLQRYSAFADELHGKNDEDTYTIIRSVVQAIQRSKAEKPLIAFLLGIVSHIQADILFHPLVFSKTGNYSSPYLHNRTKAIQRHRRFEVLLDMYFVQGLSKLRDYSLKHFISALEVPLRVLLFQVTEQIACQRGLPELSRFMAKAFTIFSFMQNLYPNQMISRFLYEVEGFFTDGMKEISALFYPPQMAQQVSSLHTINSFWNPYTKQEEYIGSLEAMLLLAVENSSLLFKQVEDFLFTQSRLPLLEKHGPSLNGKAFI